MRTRTMNRLPQSLLHPTALQNSTLKPVALTVASCLTIALAGCSSSTDYNFDTSRDNAAALVAPAAAYDPGGGVIPLPNALLFAGTEDGTLNITVADPEDLSNPQVALNAQDGFSTTEAITTSYTQPLNPASLTIGTNVRVFEITTAPSGAVASIVGELSDGEIVAVPAGDGKTLAIVPLRPLKESTDYMVVLNDQIEDTSGNTMGRSFAFGLTAGSESLADGAAAALEPVRQLTGAMLLAASSQGIDPNSVTLTWTFKTQSITPVLQAVKAASTAANIAVTPAGFDTTAIGGQGAADILVGTLEIPYYLSTPSEENPLAATQGYWTGAGDSNLTQFNPQPVAQSTQTIPVLMTMPNANSGMSKPAAGWPVVIFQHGITRSRTDMLAIADSMAGAGFAVVGIDLPVHGITDNESPFYSAGMERTFDMDLQGAEGAAGPDGTIDSSGAYFYNLANLLNTRDNFRQGIADLWVLSASIGNLADIDGDRKGFVGLSLGAIVGSTMLAFDNSFKSATLASPGGGVSRLFAASPVFGPQVADGLADAGIDIASSTGQAFLNATQTMMDSADPVNHAQATANSGVPIHLAQMLQDNVVLGSVPGAALSGTEPLANLMGLPIVRETSSGSGWVRFARGPHSALIDTMSEEADLEVTTELQTQMVTFAVSQGQQLPVGNAGVLEVAP